MRIGLLGTAMLMLAACSDPKAQLAACETAIKATLRIPASYRRVIVQMGNTDEIEFDASNLKGGSVRHRVACLPESGSDVIILYKNAASFDGEGDPADQTYNLFKMRDNPGAEH